MSIEETIRQIIQEEIAIQLSNINSKLDKLINKPEEKLYTRFEAAEILKVTPATLLNWEKAGKIMPVRKGRKVYYKSTDVNK
jgi:hypothetical protein